MIKSSLIFVTYFLVLGLSAQPGGNPTDEQGRRHGEWVKSDVYGNVLYEGQFEHGEPVGKFVYYFKEGGKKAEMVHESDSDTSHAKLFYQQEGDLMAEGKYVNEQRVGLWKFYDPAGNLNAEEPYKDGKKHGTVRIYYDDGSISETAEYVNGEKNGEWIRYYPNGNLRLEATVRDDIYYEGEFVQYYKDGKPMMKGEYVDGEKESSWYHYNEDGSIEVIYVYRNGKQVEEHPQNGTFEKFYFDDLPKSEYTYKNGEKHGPFKEWYHMGEWVEKKVEGESMGMPTRRVEKLVGTQLKREGRYANGKLDGKVITYNQDGSIKEEEVYDNGELVE